MTKEKDAKSTAVSVYGDVTGIESGANYKCLTDDDMIKSLPVAKFSGRSIEIGEREYKSIHAVILHDSKLRRMYMKKLEKGVNAPPDCYSTDCIKPSDKVPAEKRGNHVCDSCPWNQFGTALEDGAGKRCREFFFIMMMVTLDGGPITNDSALMPFPVKLLIPPSGLKTFTNFMFNDLSAPDVLWPKDVDGKNIVNLVFKTVEITGKKVDDSAINYSTLDTIKIVGDTPPNLFPTIKERYKDVKTMMESFEVSDIEEVENHETDTPQSTASSQKPETGDPANAVNCDDDE